MCKKSLIVGLVVFIGAGLLRFSAPAQETVPVQEPTTSADTVGTAPVAFIITGDMLRELRKQELSEELLTQLEVLKDTLFHTEALFLSAIEEAIGQEVLDQHQSTFLELAYVYDSTGRREPFKAPFEPDTDGVVTISENCITIKETKRYEKGDEVTEEEPETDLCLKTTDE